MKRREFVEKVSLGTAAALSIGAAPSAREQGHGHRPIEGPLSSATVSFGQWPAGATPTLDRMATPDAPAAANTHLLIPYTAKIKVGGAVNFILAGFHQIVVYAPGKRPVDVNTSTLIPIPGLPPFLGLIDDPAGRVYRGLNPADHPQDRVEVVQFHQAGLHLVICAFSVHFINDGMYGWVDVLP
jgi:hypothetical protein